ncbi:MAG: hypothetical protein AB1640_05970 [bacterium]
MTAGPFAVRRPRFMPLSRKAQNRLILGSFFGFLLFIGFQNQLRMTDEIEAFRNDAYVMRLRQVVRTEFLASRAGRAGALDVTARIGTAQLGQIIAKLADTRPEGLLLEDGPAGSGRLTGLGHPFLGGRPERTVWRLVAGRPGGTLEIEAHPEQEPARERLP